MIRFEWHGNTETESGKAIYITDTSAYELWLPSLAKARQLESVLRDVFAEGRHKGRMEVMHAVNNVMNGFLAEDI